jgi:predicted metalloprotease with PDZ domain
LVALCLDLSLRLQGKTHLDAVMRGLWLRCAAGPMREQDLKDELQAQTSRDWSAELASWVHSTAELPVLDLLAQHGVAVVHEPSQLAQALGLRVADGASLVVKSVLRGGAAEHAGFAPGDEWLAVQVPHARKNSAPAIWRLHKLEDLPLYMGAAKKAIAWVSRDKQVVQLPWVMPATETTVRLVAQDSKRLSAWLA